MAGAFLLWRHHLVNINNLHSKVKNVVDQLGYRCWGVEFNAGKHRALLRVFIDHPEGITHDDCSSVSHQLSSVLDVESPIKQSYTLEVSSPGVERPLLEVDHYRCYVGSKVRVNCYVPINDRKTFVGRIESVCGRTLILKTDIGCVEIPVDEVKRARLVFESA